MEGERSVVDGDNVRYNEEKATLLTGLPPDGQVSHVKEPTLNASRGSVKCRAVEASYCTVLYYRISCHGLFCVI